jgi:hypothetical protein
MMNAENVRLYMRLSGDQARYWTCISAVGGCAHCRCKEHNELVFVTLEEDERDFVISLCAGCIVRLKIPDYMLLRGRLSDEAYSNIQSGRLRADHPCNECGRYESTWRMFSLGPDGHQGHFLCGGCSHRWSTQGEAGLPNILAAMHNKEVRQ